MEEHPALIKFARRKTAKEGEMCHKLVSILVPAYNHENYIIDCLESVKKQTYTDIELIILDDFSSDYTYFLAQRWCVDNSNYFLNCEVYQNTENCGVARNCNILLGKAKGYYIKFIASDDMLMPNAISDMVAFFEDNTDYDFIFSNGYHVLNCSTYPISKECISTVLYKKIPPHGKGIFDELYKKDYIAAPTVMLKRTTFDRYGLYSEGYVFEDWEYWLRVAVDGNIGYLKKKTVAYRDAPVSLSRFTNDKQGRQRFEKFIGEQKRLLENYSKYTEVTMRQFWDDSIGLAMRIHHDDFIKKVLDSSEVGYKPSVIRRLKLLVYKTKIYDFWVKTR